MSPRKKASSLPKFLTPGLELPTLYKAGLHAELQKFGSSSRDLQLPLWLDPQQEPELTVSGLDLTVSEDKALSALQILLDRTDYEGNAEDQEVDSQAFHFRGSLPRLAISYSAYFEAYGLERKGDASFYGHQAEEAVDALRSLALKPRALYYERKHYKGKKQLSNIIRFKAPLITIEEVTAWQDLEQAEAEQVKAGQEVPDKQRITSLLIEFSPLLVDGIKDFYLLKPTALHRQIQDHLGKRRISRAVSLFIEWLLCKGTAIVRIKKTLLAERLRMEKYLRQRQWYRIEPQLLEAIQTAKELGYLLSWKEEPPGLYTFWLNSEKCSRVQSQEEETEEGEPVL